MDRRSRALSIAGGLLLSALATSPVRGDRSASPVDPTRAPIDEASDEELALSVDPEIVRRMVAEGMLPAEDAARIRALLDTNEVAFDTSTAETVSLPVGGSRSAATPSALPLPTGEGSIEGLGESFSASLSSGALSFTLPIALPPGRAGLAPTLALGYSSGGGSSDVGYGWGLGVAAISRQTDRGLPRYVDRARWHPEEDRFVYAGSHELVPVDSAAMTALDGGTTLPELAGWQQYRAEVEGSFMRFYRAPDSTRWVVQSSDGTRHDLGLLPAGDGSSSVVAGSRSSLLASPDGARIASWGLARTTDAHGSTIHYTYETLDGQRYLTAAYWVSPASCAAGSVDARMRCAASLDQYAMRARIVYEDRPDATTSHRHGWAIRTSRRVRRIEVTAAADSLGARTLVRRYHLAYDARSYHSLLRSVTIEGRPEAIDPATGAMIGDRSVAEHLLGDAIVGATSPPVVFRYSSDARLARGVDGFPALDGRRQRAVASPGYSAGDPRADLYDVNSDGLVDLLVTDPVRFRTSDGGPAVGVFFNGFSGTSAAPAAAGTFSAPVSVGVDGALAASMQLDNPNVVPMDVDGDGRSDLLHMPRSRSYGYFTPVRAPGNVASPAAQQWRFAYLDVALPDGALDPRIDLGRDGQRIRAIDVNADSLVDVVRTSGDAIQTWLNLGFHEGGEGRFGSPRWENGAWALSTDPIESCLPASGAPVSFDDPEVRLADMNGDGLQDIVRLGPGSLVWWPGLGHGRFGEDCAAGVRRASPIVTRAPRDLGASLDRTYLADIDGDGASDLVRVSDALDVWFNMGGTAFSRRASIDALPWSRDLERVVRFADIDGSGSTDIVFARSRGWEWIDPMGGERPRLLVQVDNGLGASTRFELGSSVEDYLRDLAAASACGSACDDAFYWQGRDDGECDARVEDATGECLVRSTGSPVVNTVVRAVETSDRLDVLGASPQVSRVEHAYHDAYFEGIEQESRGFGATDVRSVGGIGQGTSITRSWMHQGRRPRSIAADRLATNPFESLKGRTYLAETWDEADGAVISTTHTALRIRRLVVGLDGREVAWALPMRTDEIRYDLSGAWTPAAAGARIPFASGGDQYPVVVRELVGADGAALSDAGHPGWSAPIARRSAGAFAVIARTVDQVDHVGHVLVSTAWGRVKTEWDEPLVGPEEIVSHSVPLLIDPARWIWRTREQWTSGHGSSARLGETRTEFDPGAIDPSRVVGVVTIPRAYRFDADTDGSLGYTQVAEDLVTSFSYDAWGNVVTTCVGASTTTDARCLRHSTVAYDDAYQQLPVREAVAVERVGSTYRTLAWTGRHDRGLGQEISSTDPRGGATEVGHDGLGRPTFLRTPNVRGCEASNLPRSVVRYAVTADAASAPLSVFETRTLTSCTDPSRALVTREYVDGRGRTRATLVRTDAPHAWTRTGLIEHTPRGLPHRTSGAAFLDAAEPSLAQVLALTGAEEWASTGYDAFGRTRYTQPLGATHSERSWVGYGATWSYACDPFDFLSPGYHVGARTCSYARNDGHGRVEDTILQQRRDLAAGIETYRLWPSYRADGELIALQRVETSNLSPRSQAASSIVAGHRVTRTFALDSQGRRLASTDRDTDARRAGTTELDRSWRYLWNRASDLVAVRDPRGCGQNFFYDRAGRAVAEDYVACASAEPALDQGSEWTPADAITLDPLGAASRVEIRMHYDTYPAWAVGGLTPPSWATSAQGLATASSDRGARSVVAYDARGSTAWTARQMAILPVAAAAPATLTGALPVVAPTTGITRTARRYDELHTYVSTLQSDHAGRATSSSLPRDPDFAGSSAPSIGGRITYDQRGLPSSVGVAIGGDYHPILSSARYARDGLLEEAIYGDDANETRIPTRTEMAYDHRRRVDRVTTTREPSVTGSTDRSLAGVAVVMDQDFEWDELSNLLAITDRRPGEEWADGHRPQSVSMRYDALWHVTGVDFEYATDDGVGASDAATDYRAVITALEDVDPMRELAAPSVSPALASRVVSMTWDYDFLGNTTETTDDLAAFYERSLDRVTNGLDEVDGRPSAMRMATSISTGGHSYSATEVRGGWLEIDYGDSGNVDAVTVHGECRDVSSAALCSDGAGTPSTRRNALRARCACAVEQHYQYRLDEVNRIVDARRYDRAGAGSWSLATQLRYGFDSANDRTVKEVRDALAAPRYAIWPYGGDFERRGLVRGTSAYEAVAGTETSYLVGGARVVWEGGTEGTGLDPDHRITLPIADLLHTASAVIDLRSGELLEVSTYYPNGARETIATTDREGVPLEPYGFTAKEADESVGLTYFGQRFLMPRVGRWATPDPLHIHADGGGEAMNNYHYVSGNLLQARDPIGLDADADALAANLEDAGVHRPAGTTPHHILPLHVERKDAFFQLIQRYGSMNQAMNGVFLPHTGASTAVGALHDGFHTTYNNAMKAELLEIASEYNRFLGGAGGLNEQQALGKVDELIERARGALLAESESMKSMSTEGWRQTIRRAPRVALIDYAQFSQAARMSAPAAAASEPAAAEAAAAAGGGASRIPVARVVTRGSSIFSWSNVIKAGRIGGRVVFVAGATVAAVEFFRCDSWNCRGEAAANFATAGVYDVVKEAPRVIRETEQSWSAGIRSLYVPGGF